MFSGSPSKDWVDHIKEFGGGESIYVNAFKGLERQGREIALMEKFGTNPADTLFNPKYGIVRRIQEAYRKDTNGLEKFNAEVKAEKFLRPSLETVMGHLDGRLTMPVNAEWAKRFNAFMAVEAMSKLGGVQITHLFAAPLTISSELTHHGINRLDAIGGVLKATATGRGSVERQALMADAAAYGHGYNLEIGARPPVRGGVPGYVAWRSAQFMRMTGLPAIMDRLQANGVKSVLMRRLGAAIGKDFKDVEPHQANVLQKYGIGEKEWNLLRQAENPLEIEGQRYVTPSDVDRIKDETIAQHLGLNVADEGTAAALQKFRWGLSDRILQYLHDASTRGIVTPGVRERAMVLGKDQPGSTRWMIARALAQFKMWPLAATNQMIMRDIATSLNSKERAANVFWMLALGTAGGALRMSVNDVASGRPQRNYLDPVTLARRWRKAVASAFTAISSWAKPVAWAVTSGPRR